MACLLQFNCLGISEIVFVMNLPPTFLKSAQFLSPFFMTFVSLVNFSFYREWNKPPPLQCQGVAMWLDSTAWSPSMLWVQPDVLAGRGSAHESWLKQTVLGTWEAGEAERGPGYKPLREQHVHVRLKAWDTKSLTDRQCCAWPQARFQVCEHWQNSLHPQWFHSEEAQCKLARS